MTVPGVFRPRSDAWLLVRELRPRVSRGTSVLDVFTGSGVLAVAAAQAGAESVVAVDLSRRAVLCVRANARLNGVEVDARRGELFEPVAGEHFDLLVANPPYVPGDAELPASGAARAWEGGLDGRALLDRLCEGAGRHLADGGTVLIVQSSISGEVETIERLTRAGLDAEVVRRHRGPLGPLVAARAAELEERGILTPGQSEEELLVIRAHAVRGSS